MARRQLYLMDIAIGETTLRIAGVVFGESDAQCGLLPIMRFAAGVVIGENGSSGRNRLARIKSCFQRQTKLSKVARIDLHDTDIDRVASLQ